MLLLRIEGSNSMKLLRLRHMLQLLITVVLIVLMVGTPFAVDRISAYGGEKAGLTADQLDAEFVGDWVQLLYTRVQLDKLSPPAGSRVYGYTSVALWESILNGMPGRNTLAGQLMQMPDMPLLPDNTVDYDW